MMRSAMNHLGVHSQNTIMVGDRMDTDVVAGMHRAFARRIAELVPSSGRVVLIGGVTRNRFIVEFLKEAWPSLEFVVPAESPYFEAYGAMLLAADRGAPLPDPKALFRTGAALSYATFPPLASSGEVVRYVTSRRGAYAEGAEYILGVDGGSTTTKIALINAETLEIVAEHYGRTHGDPVAALKTCVAEVLKRLGERRPRISLVASTGSSRELLGVFLETPAVYNEIIAHTVGTTFFEPEVDTIFEIGGQDAKYVFINNVVPIDYAMNEACSAGTGSFLEESARGDLNIDDAAAIGPVALEARAPLKFGEHCSAFINSDVRKAIQECLEVRAEKGMPLTVSTRQVEVHV
jgi:activator of 2-hydroxyglutaryl-CoA dehydratase